jgi:hypothetical protein
MLTIPNAIVPLQIARGERGAIPDIDRISGIGVGASLVP